MKNQKIKTMMSMTCHHPRRIRVKDHLQTVACGKCAACRVSKIKRLISRINQHAKRYKYMRFVTLTYDPKHLPILDYEVLDQIPIAELKDFHYDSVNKLKYHVTEVKEVLFKPRKRDMTTNFRYGRKRSESIEEPFSYYVPTLSLEKLRMAQHAPLNQIYYAPTTDIQLFIKRLKHEIIRKYRLNTCKSEIQQESRNKSLHTEISYYAIREFGENFKRPHWHLLLFFNSDYIAEHISDSVHKSWQYGLNRTELPRSSCSSYVASYLQCSTVDFELFNRVPEIRPKYYSSINFGDDILPKRINLSRFDEIANIAVNGRVTDIDGTFVCIFPKWSDYNRLFFRPKGYVFGPPTLIHSIFRQVWYAAQANRLKKLEHDYSPIIDPNVPLSSIARYIINDTMSAMRITRSMSSTPNALEYCDFAISNPTLAPFIHYADVQYMIYELFKISYSQEDYFGSYIITHPHYEQCVARIVRHLGYIRNTLLAWNIKNSSDAYLLATKLYNFHKDNDTNKLINDYCMMRDTNDSEFTNFIYSLKYNAYGHTTEAEIYEVSANLKRNSLFSDSGDQALQELEQMKNHKKIKHLMSNL